MAAQYPENLAALRAAVFERLNAKHRNLASEPEWSFRRRIKRLRNMSPRLKRA